jgi:uncharacterized protein YjbJ (UPF0337 family)
MNPSTRDQAMDSLYQARGRLEEAVGKLAKERELEAKSPVTPATGRAARPRS